ncbi:hypothetical protein BpHYR1_015446, partial [Brachionus plicatilis]
EEQNRKIKELESQLAKFKNIEKENNRNLDSYVEDFDDVLTEIEDERENGRRYPVSSAQPIFEGKLSEDVESWLFSLDINLRNANIPKSEKIFYAGSYCKGNAQQVYKAILKANPKITWTEFKQEFLKRFKNKNIDDIVIKKLVRMKQNGSIQDYINQFQLSLNQTSDIDEKMKIRLFKFNIRPEIEGYLNMREPETIDQAFSWAILYENNVLKRENREDRINAFRSQGNNISKCYYCGKPGHFKVDCYARKRFQNHKIRNEIPRNYHEKRYDQYSSKRPQENQQKYKYNGKNGQGKYYRSDKRKYNNENKRDYLQKISVDDDEMDISAVRIGCLKNYGQQNELKIKGTINGMNAEMLIDTGAQRSVISEKAFQRLKLDISKNVNIVKPIGSKSFESRITKKVEIETFGKIIKLELAIVPYCFTDVLLGADCLIMADAGTWLSRQLVWFGDESEIIKINQNKCVQKFDRFTKYTHTIGRIEELDENIDENLNEIDPFDDDDFSI